MAKVFVSIPCMNGQIETNCMLTLKERLSYHHEPYLKFIVNSSLIPKARQDHFGMFLNDPQYDYLFSIDADIVSGLRNVNPQHPEGTLDRLISHNKDFIGGVYAKKALHEDTGLEELNGKTWDPNEEFIMDGRLIKMEYLPTGYMLISRKAATKMVEAYPELYYEDDRLPCRWTWAMYNMLLVKDEMGIPRFLPEDFSFCRRWTDIGGEIWADTSIQLGHIGKYLYTLQHLER